MITVEVDGIHYTIAAPGSSSIEIMISTALQKGWQPFEITVVESPLTDTPKFRQLLRDAIQKESKFNNEILIPGLIEQLINKNRHLHQK